MSNIPSDIDTLTDAVQSAVVTASPASKNSDDKELSWSNVEDTDDDASSPRVTVVQNESPLAERVAELVTEQQPVVEQQQVVEEKPVVEQQPVVEEKPVVEQQPVVEPVAEPVAEQQPVVKETAEEKQPAEEQPVLQKEPEVQKVTVPPLIIDDDMPPLVSDESSDDEMPQLVASSDEESSDEESSDSESTDEDMPELVPDDDDVVHLIVRNSSCHVCNSAIQTLLNHDHDPTNQMEECTTPRSNNEFPPIITHILWLFILLHALNLLSNIAGFRHSR